MVYPAPDHDPLAAAEQRGFDDYVSGGAAGSPYDSYLEPMQNEAWKRGWKRASIEAPYEQLVGVGEDEFDNMDDDEWEFLDLPEDE